MLANIRHFSTLFATIQRFSAHFDTITFFSSFQHFSPVIETFYIFCHISLLLETSKLFKKKLNFPIFFLQILSPFVTFRYLSTHFDTIWSFLHILTLTHFDTFCHCSSFFATIWHYSISPRTFRHYSIIFDTF